MRLVFAALLALVLALAGCATSGDPSGPASLNAPTTGPAPTPTATTAPPSPTPSPSPSPSPTQGPGENPPGPQEEGNETTEDEEPEAVEEVFYIHGDLTMDHTPAEGREDGHGTVNGAAPVFSRRYVATEPTVSLHAAGDTVEVHFQGFTLAPHPAATVEVELFVDGALVGSGATTVLTTSVALVATPCTTWTIAFALPADVDPGAMLELQVDAPDSVLAPCYNGGPEASRVVLTA